MKSFDKYVLSFNFGLVCVAGVALMAIMAVGVVNSVLRVFSAPLGATSETVSLLAVILTSCCLGYSQIEKAHVGIDMVVNLFPKRIQKIVGGFIYLLSAAFFFMAAWQMVLYAGRLRSTNVLSETLHLPYYSITYLLAFGLFFMALLILREFILSAKKGEKE